MMTMKARTILTGGPIFKGLAEGFAEALAIADGRILAVGTAAEIDALRGPETRVIDLAGRSAIPGLIDAHLHLLNLGIAMGEINLRTESGVRDVGEILRRVGNGVAGARPGDWVLGRGYDHNELTERRHPDIAELDRIAPDNPVFLERTCSHIAVANSAALRLAGIGADTPDPEGGLIERDAHGMPTGLLAERAMRLVMDKLPRPSQGNLVTAIERAGRFMLGQGFTSVMDAAVGMKFGFDEIEAFEAAAATDRLPLRVWACLFGDPGGGVIDRAHAEGYRFGREAGLLRYGAAKIFTDGSAGGLTAAMSEPYIVGRPDNHGIMCFSDAEAHGLLRKYHAMGYQLAIHAIGDIAIEQVLSGIEQAGTADDPIAGRRHRIEHCGFLTEAQFERIRAAGIVPVPQPVFIYEFGDLYVTNVGAGRAAASYPMRDWLDAGMMPAASSDAPVSATDPFKNLYTMITRKTRAGTVIGGEQALSLAEALHCYTYCGAYSQFAENEVGRLLPGMKADIAILSADIFAASPETIRDEIECVCTLVGGIVVHDGLSK